MKEFLKVISLTALLVGWLITVGNVSDELNFIFYTLAVAPPCFIILNLIEFYFENKNKARNVLTALGFFLKCARRAKSVEYSDSSGTYLIKKIK